MQSYESSGTLAGHLLLSFLYYVPARCNKAPNMTMFEVGWIVETSSEFTCSSNHVEHFVWVERKPPVIPKQNLRLNRKPRIVSFLWSQPKGR
uniref:Uncharacterized protein n=1 Tax=Oryza punctata TaxID=4537 RepID=A0A0E0LUK5_ORYPU